MSNDDRYPVNRGASGNLPIKDHIQDSLTCFLETVTQRHSKTFVVRTDCRYPQSYKAPGDNKDISRMTAKLVQKYKRLGYDPQYFWVREQNESTNPHYHMALAFNGHKIKSPYKIMKAAEDLWQSTLNTDVTGCVHRCDNAAVMLDRAKPDFDERFAEAHYRLSYLAKEKDKGAPKDGVRDFGMSRLRKRK